MLVTEKQKVDILIVEDSPTQAEQLKYLLEKNRYSTAIAENGKCALDMLERCLPTVIISDICMPVMDGYELCRRIKTIESTAEIPVILLTSLSNPEDVIEGLECGADNFITKPFTTEYLLSHVEHIIATRSLYQTKRNRIEAEILFAGKHRIVKADQQQLVTLLISTYEAAVIRNRELLQIQEELQTTNDQLEEVVEKRTQELRINEEKYLDLYNNAPSMFVSVAYPKGLVIECNETLLRLTGFSRSEMIGMDVYKLYHPDRVEKTKEILESFLKCGELKNQEIDLNTKTGGKIPVLINSSAVRDENGNILHSRSVIQDISDLKKAQQDLRQSEERYRAVADTAVDSIITVNDSGIIVGWNQGATKTFGYDEKEIVGQHLVRLIPEDFSSFQHAGFKRLKEGENAEIVGGIVELQGIRKNGEVFPFEISLAQWRSSNEQFFTGIIRDITQRKQVEKELLKAKEKAVESDHLKSAFLANMSHEIRTPMNGILGFSQLLKDTGLTSNEKERYIEAIDKSTHQLLQIITDIVDISKIEAGQEKANLVFVNLNDLLDEVRIFFETQANQRNLKLLMHSELAADHIYIKTDPVKLRQVLNNIIGNALKFTEKGMVVITVSNNEHNLIFSIKDTGIGIDPSFHAAIFNRFMQLKSSISRIYGGTGLGLSLSKSYVEMLGGSIRVDSTPGEGSIFTFEIPWIPESVPMVEKKTEKTEISFTTTWSNKILLIAEDEENNSFFLKTLLKSTGIKILEAVNGCEAVEMCKKHPEIEIVLMDIKMPEMDGMTATRIIRSFRSDLPVIATTAFALSSDKEKCLDAGCTDYLSKPIKRDHLISMIGKYLNK